MFGDSAAQAVNQQFKVAVTQAVCHPAASEMVKELSWLADLRKDNKAIW